MAIMEGHEARRHMVDDKKIKRRLRRTRRFRLTYTMRAGNLGWNKLDDDDGRREEKYEGDKKQIRLFRFVRHCRNIGSIM